MGEEKAKSSKINQHTMSKVDEARDSNTSTLFRNTVIYARRNVEKEAESVAECWE